MGVSDSIKDAYYSLEDKWYSFVDAVSEKAPFVGNTVDWLEDKGIPSFPLAIILVILLIIVLFMLFFSTAAAPLTINVVDGSGSSIVGATVTIFSGEKTIASNDTSDEGKAVFTLASGKYSVKVEKEGYSTSTREVETNKEETFTLNSTGSGTTKSVYMKTADGQIITGAGTVRYYCKGNESDVKTAFYQDGKFDAEFSSACTEIVIESVSGYKVITGTASFSGGSVTVEKEEINTGTVRVNLSATETVPPGIRVVLTSEDGVPQQTLVTETGVVVFQNVPTKKYYVTIYDARIDPAIKYAPYDGKKLGELKQVAKGQTTEFNISLEKVVSAKITVNVRDVDNSSPLTGAEVSLALASNNNKVEKKVTGATGQVVFDVAENETYVIGAEHPEYLIGTANAQASVPSSQKSVELFLVKATAENSQSLNVKVVDKDNAPIDSVKIVLKKLDETIIDEKTTGANGIADFYNLDIGQYYAYAAKDEYTANSASVQVLPRKQANLDIKLDIGKGTIKLRVLDSENAPLKGANVKLINFYTQKQEEQKTTDAQGYVEFSARADKTIYFVAEAANWLKYNTATVRPDEGAPLERDIVMVKPTGQLTATILPLQSGNTTVAEKQADRTVSAGVYSVRAIVAVPKGTFAEAGLHLRTGKAIEGTTNTMEEDNARLGNVASSATKTIKGTTFTPPNGSDKDLKSTTSGDAKWVNFVWRNPTEGVYEAEAELSISEVNPNQGINLWYRGWAKGSSVLRDPASAVQSNELYAVAKNYIMSGGAANLCSNGVCKAYTLQILSGKEAGRKLYINNSFTGKKGVQYLLTADITNNTGKAITGATLNLETVGIDANAIIVNGVEHSGKQVSLGTIGIDGYIQVKIPFTITSAGSDTLKLSITSAIKTEFEDTITATVAANKKFTFEVIPKEIIPYIINSMFFETKDGNNAVTGVLVEIKKGLNVLGTVETSGEGLATFELPAPTIGDKITIKATKEGYETIVIEKEVDKSILIVTPPEISDIIKIGETKSIEETVLLENATTANVKIKSIDFTGELKSYLDLKFSDNLVGSTIEKEKDKNYTLTIKPNATGSKLREPKDVKGEVVIAVEIAGTKQLFETVVPVNIRLSMPGFLDSGKCLKVTPTSIDLIAGGTETTKTIEVENTCTAEGIQVNLHNIQGKLNEASKLGSISINGKGFSGTLSETYTKIGAILEKDSKETLTIRFVPNGSIASGTQNLTITLKGENIPEENEKEDVEVALKAKLTMSNLSKCVTVEKPAGGIVLDVAGWNLGYNRLINSNMNSHMTAYSSQYRGFSNRGGMMPYGMQQALPFMSGPQGQQGRGQQQAPNSSYEQSSFTIKNACAVDVEIDLDPDSRLNVSEEKFTIGKDSDNTVTVTPGYTLGRYKVVVNAKPANSEESKKNIDSVSVLVRKLGDIDRDCIKINTTRISLNSFIYQSKKYKAYNYCYDSGVQIARGNNAVTIQCDAPNMIMQPAMMNQMMNVQNPQPYFQRGMEGLYGGSYPLNNVYNSYYDYVTPQGCGGNQCVMVTGTRVYSQNLSEGSRGTTEEIIFEVMPNASYMPQRKLFNNNTGQYGLFQSLGDIRAWLTETDARTNIYGNVNVQYSNQYGSTQCMSFPVEIEDDWRMLESIDSAINWGDPNARPSECVEGEHKTRALNIYQYWLERGNTKGAVPDNEYRNSGVYLHVAVPPAVKIGPAPNAQFGNAAANMYYPYNSWNNSMTQGKQESSGEAKNCGLLDRISNLKYQNEVGGVIIAVEGTTQGGSIINNTKGPNLMVSLNRSGIKGNCVYIDQVVRGKLSRAINFYSEEVTWNLKALVAKPGYKVTATNQAELEKECITSVDFDQTQCAEYLRQIIASTPRIEKEKDADYAARIYKALVDKYPQCARYYSVGTVLGGTTVTTKEGCSTEPAKYGFSLIKETITEEAAKKIENFCVEGFCNTTMLDLFLKSRAKKVITEASSSGVGCTKGKNKTGMLSTLYKEAETVELKECNKTATTLYYAGNNGLVEENYTIPTDTVGYKEKIENVKKGPEMKNAVPITDMMEIINALGSKDKEVLLVKFASLDKTKIDDGLKTNLGLKEANGAYYMTYSYYYALNEAVNKKYPACEVKDKECEITMCGLKFNMTPTAMKALAEGIPRLVKGVTTTLADKNALEAEKVIVQNTKLANIKKLAVFSSTTKIVGASKELYLTQITSGKVPTDQAIKSADIGDYKDYTVNYYIGSDEKKSLEVGKYEGEIDLSLCVGGTGATTSITIDEAEYNKFKEDYFKAYTQMVGKVEPSRPASTSDVIHLYNEESKNQEIWIKTANNSYSVVRYANSNLLSQPGKIYETYNAVGDHAGNITNRKTISLEEVKKLNINGYTFEMNSTEDWLNIIVPSSTASTTDKTIKLIVKETEFKEAPEAKKNILLQKEFETETDADSITDSAKGIVIGVYDGKTKLFSRTPVKLTAEIYGGETALNYTIKKSIAAGANLSLMKWFEGSGSGADKKVATGFTYAMPASQSARTIKGLYYYTNDGALIFQANTFGGKVSAEVVGVTGTANPSSITLPTNKTQSTQAIEVTGTGILTLNDVVKKTTEGTTCIAVDGQSVLWNETQLLK